MKKPAAHIEATPGRARLNRLLRRMLGDQTGAVMMEYVVLGVLIVGAVVAAVIFFGKTILNQFGVMTHAATGDTKSAQSMVDESNSEREGGIDNAKERRKGMSNDEFDN